ncbi:MAG: hypothetical protein ABIR46_02365, partial [Candidatus Saccharimonadales bacterium]
MRLLGTGESSDRPADTPENEIGPRHGNRDRADQPLVIEVHPVVGHSIPDFTALVCAIIVQYEYAPIRLESPLDADQGHQL